MSEKLKPCPFCGGAAHLRELIEHYPASADGPAGSYSAWCHIGCDACGVEVGGEYKSEAIAAWNRRTPSLPSADGLEGIKAIAHRLALWEPGVGSVHMTADELLRFGAECAALNKPEGSQ